MSNRPDPKPLLKDVEPRKFALRGVELTGFVPEAGLSRLTAAVVRVESVHANVRFDIDDQGHKVLTGRVAAELVRECQRCLGECHQTVVGDINLAIVWDDEQARQLTRYEPWLVTEESADLHNIVEEEILLNMPFVSFHDHECIPASALQSEAPQVSNTEEQANPFELLKQLKDSKKP